MTWRALLRRRRALVLLRSVEGTYWAGSYGTKFASAELRFLRRCEVRGFGARESQAFWRSRRAGAPDAENDAEAEDEAAGSDSDSDDDSQAESSDEDDEDEDGSEDEE
jgi:chromosome condensin MukBEF MukE localization factor